MKTTIRLITTSLFGLALMAYGQDNNASVPRVEAVPHTANNSKDSVDVSPATTFDPHLGSVTSTAAFVGSSVLQRKVVDVFSPQFNFGTSSPAAISCQPRQTSPFLSTIFHDTFACQVVSTGSHFIRVRIQRLDQPTGWGQNLRLDFIVFSAFN